MAKLKYPRQTAPETVTFGRNLRAARIAKGIILRDMAEQLGMSYGWLSEVERGKASLNITYMSRLANFVGLTIIELLSE